MILKPDTQKLISVLYDGYYFPFNDKEFDIGWSNAVIEHVSDIDRQILFLKEINRICKKAYFTTPNRYFPFGMYFKNCLNLEIMS